MISATPSGGWLQSSPVIPELGFCLGSRAQMFWLEEDQPGSLAPGKRPRTTLSPTMALRDGEPYLSWGSPGGDRPGSMDHAIFPAACPCQDEFTRVDRRAGLALRAFPEFVLAAHRAARRDGDRRPRAEKDRRRIAAPRPHRRGRAGLVGRPAHRRIARSAAAAAPPPMRAACRVTRRGAKHFSDAHRTREFESLATAFRT